jgi:hypothetical protein
MDRVLVPINPSVNCWLVVEGARTRMKALAYASAFPTEEGAAPDGFVCVQQETDSRITWVHASNVYFAEADVRKEQKAQHRAGS